MRNAETRSKHCSDKENIPEDCNEYEKEKVMMKLPFFFGAIRKLHKLSVTPSSSVAPEKENHPHRITFLTRQRWLQVVKINSNRLLFVYRDPHVL